MRMPEGSMLGESALGVERESEGVMNGRMMGRTMACLVVAGSLGVGLVGLAPVPAGAASKNYHKHVACNEAYRDSALHTEQACYGNQVNWDHTNPAWREGQAGEQNYYYCYVNITCDYGYPAVSKANLNSTVRLTTLYQLRRCKDDATKIATDCEPLPYYGTGQQDDPAN